MYNTTLRCGTGVLGLVGRRRSAKAASAFSLRILTLSSACLASSSRFLRASSVASLRRLFSCTHILSQAFNRSSRLFSSIISSSAFCRSNNRFSSSSSINLPCGTKQKSKSSSLTAAIRGSSSDVTLIPLSLSSNTLARWMSSKA